MQSRPSARVTVCLIACLATFLVAGRRPANQLPAVGSQLFLGPKANPIALSNDGTVVYALNSSAGTLTIRSAVAPYTLYANIAVGVEPTSSTTSFEPLRSSEPSRKSSLPSVRSRKNS